MYVCICLFPFPVYYLPPYVLNVIFSWEDFNFGPVQTFFLFSFFVASASWFLTKKYLLTPSFSKSYPMISSRIYVALTIMVRSMNYLKLMLVYAVRYEFKYTLFHLESQFVHHLLKSFIFLFNFFSWKSIDHTSISIS